MSLDSAPAVQEPDIPAAHTPPPGLLALFLAFARMSRAGFGGVLVFARHAIVDQHRWMTADEFNETFALHHFLPGARHSQSVDGVRLAPARDRRRRGRFTGLLPPTLTMTVLAIIYGSCS